MAAGKAAGTAMVTTSRVLMISSFHVALTQKEIAFCFFHHKLKGSDLCEAAYIGSEEDHEGVDGPNES